MTLSFEIIITFFSSLFSSLYVKRNLGAPKTTDTLGAPKTTDTANYTKAKWKNKNKLKIKYTTRNVFHSFPVDLKYNVQLYI